ncbi:MAG: hypothetical protein J0H98_10470 [Solirubrobacterales bacterium]|nr:hypothetical protein [Solirubrobacterales bacterium]
MRRFTGVLTLIGVALTMFAGAQAAQAAKTVKVSGKAFVFNHMDTYISGATIKVREFPKISTTTDALGDYVLTVPNDANVTPYILSGEGLLTKHDKTDDSPTGTVQTHWNEIDLQTFHTRGQAIENANFQTPADFEYNALKGILKVPAREDGRPEQCAIVTTASARNVRGVDYHGYWVNTPHGVPGATSVEYPALDGPIYFNQFVIPDPTKTETSEDGGIVWTNVPAGPVRIVTKSPTDRFASFLATCAPGRVINANPPWGAYQLSPGEKPLAASNVAASVISAKIVKQGKQRRVARVALNIGENIEADVNVNVRGGGVGMLRQLKPRIRRFNFPIFRQVKARKATIVVKLKDASGVSFRTVKKVNVPKIAKPKKKWKKRR